jgi:hypothetical protein
MALKENSTYLKTERNSCAHRRRFGLVNVIYFRSIHMCGREEGNGDLLRGLKWGS